MPRRKGEANTTALIVREGLKGKPGAELCHEPQLRQAQDSQWRDHWRAHAPHAVEVHAQGQREARLAREHARLKTRGGDLTLAFTNSAAVLGGARTLPGGPRVTQPWCHGSRHAQRRRRVGATAAAGPPCTSSRSSQSSRSAVCGGCGSLTAWASLTGGSKPNARPRAQPQPPTPNEWWGIDMPNVLGQGFGWVSRVLVLEGSTQAMVGDQAGSQCAARPWLVALDMAVTRQGPAGGRDRGLCWMRDNGCPPTSTAFMRACGLLTLHPAFTSDNNPQGNADTERVVRPRQAACLWRHAWTCPVALSHALRHWLARYHEPDLPSALGSKAPRQLARDDHVSHGTQAPAA